MVIPVLVSFPGTNLALQERSVPDVSRVNLLGKNFSVHLLLLLIVPKFETSGSESFTRWNVGAKVQRVRRLVQRVKKN